MSTLHFDQKVLFWMGGRPDGQRRWGKKPATAQLRLGLGLSLATILNSRVSKNVSIISGIWLILRILSPARQVKDWGDKVISWNTSPHPPAQTLNCMVRVGNEQFSENKSWESIRDLKTAFEPYPNPKNSPLGPKKANNDPKIRPTINVRIQGNVEN